MKDIRIALGENIRLLRKKKGLTQSELAELTGLHRTYVGGIERGERNVSIDNIARISSALDVAPHILLDPDYSHES